MIFKEQSSRGIHYQSSVFILISFGVASLSAQQCMNNATFRPNSTYDANRHLILSSLPSNVTAQDGFYYNSSIGQEPDRVFAIGMCIPGSAPDDCSDCIKTASDGLIQSCPNQTDAFSWAAEPTLCHVRYSNASFSGSADLEPRKLLYNTRDLNSNQDNMGRLNWSYDRCNIRTFFPLGFVAFGNITVVSPAPQPPSSAGGPGYMLDNNDHKGISPGVVVVTTGCYHLDTVCSRIGSFPEEKFIPKNRA